MTRTIHLTRALTTVGALGVAAVFGLSLANPAVAAPPGTATLFVDDGNGTATCCYREPPITTSSMDS